MQEFFLTLLIIGLITLVVGGSLWAIEQSARPDPDDNLRIECMDCHAYIRGVTVPDAFTCVSHSICLPCLETRHDLAPIRYRVRLLGSTWLRFDADGRFHGAPTAKDATLFPSRAAADLMIQRSRLPHDPLEILPVDFSSVSFVPSTTLTSH